jgi:hypothetical protein
MMRVLRFRIRTLMIAVAIVGAVFALRELRRRSERFTNLAKLCSKKESFGLNNYELNHRYALGIGWDEFPQAMRDKLSRGNFETTASFWLSFARENAARRAKYERAARFPWILVAPDPPDPEWSTAVRLGAFR